MQCFTVAAPFDIIVPLIEGKEGYIIDMDI